MIRRGKKKKLLYFRLRRAGGATFVMVLLYAMLPPPTEIQIHILAEPLSGAQLFAAQASLIRFTSGTIAARPTIPLSRIYPFCPRIQKGLARFIFDFRPTDA
ncbi:hypothetical protein BDZ91DRAFT_547573 [Kalaharituber pfeilii]|nr:hypothetical protein BDZ91DRAFT_547573 [Kalaharituber pfeilii]